MKYQLGWLECKRFLEHAEPTVSISYHVIVSSVAFLGLLFNFPFLAKSSYCECRYQC